MRTVLHAGRVTTQQRGGDTLWHREVEELARTSERSLQDLHGLRVLRVAGVRLLVLLGHVGRIRGAAVDESQLGAQRYEACDLCLIEDILDAQEHTLQPGVSAQICAAGTVPLNLSVAAMIPAIA